MSDASTVELVDVRELLMDDSALVPGEIEAYVELITGPQLLDFRQELRRLLEEIQSSSSPSDAQLNRAGVCCYLVGDHQRAVDLLNQVKNNGLSDYYAGLAYMSLERPRDAELKFESAAKNGYDPVDSTLHQAGAIRKQGKLDDAEQLIRSVSKEGAGRAEYSFQIGCIWADRGDTEGALEYFDRAVKIDSHHSEALFWLAGEHSRYGNDDEAIRLYEQSLSRPPYYLGALMNLGVQYEDREQYKAAKYCYQRVLEQDPLNMRAMMYLKDVHETEDQFYDEEQMKREARLEQLLKRPITDFELSVRSRNCLDHMGLTTLGDLTRISENELLAGKNFGETSLTEIRALMDQHNLKVGENLHQAKTQEAQAYQQNLSPQEQALLSRPVTELNLSVRARKCMNRLGITTLGELVQRTPDELLGSRNFGVTSLNEIRTKLTDFNLRLRND